MRAALREEESEAQLVAERAQLVKERRLFEQLGASLVIANPTDELFEGYLSLVAAAGVGDSTHVEELRDRLSSLFGEQMAKLERRRVALEGQLPSPQRSEELASLDSAIETRRNLRRELLFTVAEIRQEREKRDRKADAS